jgi:hypothetical protein
VRFIPIAGGPVGGVAPVDEAHAYAIIESEGGAADRLGSASAGAAARRTLDSVLVSTALDPAGAAPPPSTTA